VEKVAWTRCVLPPGSPHNRRDAIMDELDTDDDCTESMPGIKGDSHCEGIKAKPRPLFELRMASV
jgi:hypothetical protein